MINDAQSYLIVLLLIFVTDAYKTMQTIAQHKMPSSLKIFVKMLTRELTWKDLKSEMSSKFIFFLRLQHFH